MCIHKYLASNNSKSICWGQINISDCVMNNNQNKENYFSWNNIGEMADINSHIVYASTIIGKYQWNSKIKLHLEQQLRKIVDKQNDKTLNISVVGEFSSGKSSFINALVGYELLAVNAIQGTTVAITIIEYGSSLSITLTDFYNKQTRKEYPTIISLRDELHQFTTDSKYAKNISFISVTLPSAILKNGFRIIDTPGTNSLELWHEEITKRAITDISDLSIVLTDATRPMPETLISFIEETLGNSVKDCAFVANKIDLIREKERNGILNYVKVKANHDLNIEKPLVYPFSSAALTNMFSSEKITIDNDSFLITTNSLKELLDYSLHNRVKAQARKTLQLIDQIFTTLNHDIQQIEEQYKKELLVLEKSKQVNLKPFIQKQIAERQIMFKEYADEQRFLAQKRCDNLVNSSIYHIKSKIDNCTSLDELSSYIKKGTLSEDIKKESSLIDRGTETTNAALSSLFYDEIKRFQKNFKREFEKLNILSIQIDVTPKATNIRRRISTANIRAVTTLITEELSKENWAIGGGGITGAVIGTMIFPGIGTAIGGFVGLLAGGAVAPNLQDVKNNVKSKLSVPLKSYYGSVANDVIANTNTYIVDLSKNIETEINRYFSSYNSIVNDRISKWKEQHNMINIRIATIQCEIDRIRSRQRSIKDIINRI